VLPIARHNPALSRTTNYDSDSSSSPSDSGAQPLARRGAAQAPRPRNAARRLANAFGLTGLSYMAVAATTRHLANPGTMLADWHVNPLAHASSVLRFEPRANEHTLSEARDKVLGQFGAYIDNRNDCFDANAKVVTTLPPGIAGHYNATDNTVYLAPNHVFGASSPAMHEYLHCFTHPAFIDTVLKAASNNQLANALNEGVTQWLTRQVPIGAGHSHLSGYDVAPAGAGIAKTPVELAGALVEALGDDGADTLKQAYFVGNPEALAKLDAAVFKVLSPRPPTSNAWDVLITVGGPMPRMRPEKLAEMFVGVMLLNEPQRAMQFLVQNIARLPDSQRLAFDRWMSTRDETDPQHPVTLLSVLRARTLQMRERIDANRFDAVFCKPNMEPRQRKAEMRALTDLWEPVLPKPVSRALLQLNWR
jgi:hypothetical protein